MEIYILKNLHILFSGIWFVSFISDFFFRKNIEAGKGTASEKRVVSLYMRYVNLIGILGATGILVTGILLVLLNDIYGFFQFSANHWLVTKQFIMVVILILIFVKIIPTAKKLRLELGEDLNSSEPLSENAYAKLKSLFRINFQTNLLVTLNLLLALTRIFYS